MSPFITFKQNSSKQHTINYLSTLGIMLAIVIAFEIGHLFSLPATAVESSLGLILFFTIIYCASRYGLIAAITAAFISNAYLIYAFSGPGRDIRPLAEMLSQEWFLALMLFVPAIVIGYLRDRIDNLIQRERQARLEAEEGRLQLRKVLEEMPVGVAIAKAPSGELIFSNRHLEQLMGHKIPKHEKLEDYPKNTILDDAGNPLPEHQWPLYRIIKHQETIDSEEYHYRTDEDTRLHLQIKGTPIFNNENKLVSGLVIVEDVTVDKEMLQRKDDFLSMVSHELKTPITSLKMYTQLLIKQISSNPAHNPLQELNKIENQVQKLHRIVNNMMDLATIQLDKKVFTAEPINILPIIKECIEDVSHTQPQRKIRLDQAVDAEIVGDKDRLIQVVTNLISNAVKYSPEESPITITTSVQSSNIIISVADQGLGISSKDKSKIFNRFYQERQKDGKTFPGLGLGLYFSSEIIKQHNGKIWVDSKKGHGSTFYIALPLSTGSKASDTA